MLAGRFQGRSWIQSLRKGEFFSMDADFFNAILDRQSQDASEAEAFWDARAESFLASKRTYGADLTERVVRCLTGGGMLGPETSVLDVGCGYGSYALPFAAVAKDVVAADVSSRMLELCAERAKAAGASNLQTLKHDWELAEIGDLKGRFDLVFACMCRPARTSSGLAKMTAASRGVCVVAQYVTMEDSLADSIVDELRLDRSDDPHNDRSIAWAIFNRLWLDGFLPRMAFAERSEDRTLTLEEALDRYGMGLGRTAVKQGADLRSLLSAREEEGGVHTRARAVLALISWRPEERGPFTVPTCEGR